MGVQSLSISIKNAVEKRIKEEARALHGTIKDGMFHSGGKSFPFTQAVDCNINAGKVWAQLAPNGKAVIVGN